MPKKDLPIHLSYCRAPLSGPDGTYPCTCSGLLSPDSLPTGVMDAAMSGCVSLLGQLPADLRLRVIELLVMHFDHNPIWRAAWPGPEDDWPVQPRAVLRACRTLLASLRSVPLDRPAADWQMRIMQQLMIEFAGEKTQVCGWCMTPYETDTEAAACARACSDRQRPAGDVLTIADIRDADDADPCAHGRCPDPVVRAEQEHDR